MPILSRKLCSLTSLLSFSDTFYQYGEIRSITCVPRQQCAFVEFVRRNDAEVAAERTFNTLILGGRRLNIKWGHTQGRRQPEDNTHPALHRGDMESTLTPSKNLPSVLPPLPKDLSNDFFNLAQSESIPVPPPPLPAPPMPPGFPGAAHLSLAYCGILPGPSGLSPAPGAYKP